MNTNELAIIGISFEIPSVSDLDAFWEALLSKKCLYHNQHNDLESASSSGNIVKAWGGIENPAGFDYRFFGYSYKEACHIDPQQRLLLMHSWHALENAGYMRLACMPTVGVFATCSINNYLYHNLNGLLDANCEDEILLGNTNDFLATRIAYKLNLTGPAVTVQSGCSSSLSALHIARTAILTGQCEMALVGAVSLSAPDALGYPYTAEGIRSVNGQVRPFDSQATGTVFTNGVAALVLKRYQQAIQDADSIFSVIVSSALNNDGAHKASFTAPCAKTQAQVIKRAIKVANICPEQIGLIEAHGTGTALGDPIEFNALCEVFGQTASRPWCALQSVKANSGHLDTVSGLVGLIKAGLTLKHRLIPGQLHFQQINPNIQLVGSPFYINTDSRTLNSEVYAGVTALGIGGTNAHVILRAPYDVTNNGATSETVPILLSAKTEVALCTLKEKLKIWCAYHSNINVADVAYTSIIGRTAMDYRFAVIARDTKTLSQALDLPIKDKSRPHPKNAQLAFMFPGQGAQYPGMGQTLYQRDPMFRHLLSEYLNELTQLSGRDFESLFFGTTNQAALYETENTQPILLAFEVALANTLRQKGLEPTVLFGHSLGEYTALVISEALGFRDTAQLVLKRAKLMSMSAPGRMLVVMASVDEIKPTLPDALSIAAVNAPNLLTVSGDPETIDAFAQACSAKNVATHYVKTQHGFHSRLLDPILPTWQDALSCVEFKPPRLPILSNLNGKRLDFSTLRQPTYWLRQTREPVAFTNCLITAAREFNALLLEVGPGTTLKNFAKHTLTHHHISTVVANTLPHPKDKTDDNVHLLTGLSELWQAGVEIDWPQFITSPGKRVGFPTYPFELKRCWIHPSQQRHKKSVDFYQSYFRTYRPESSTAYFMEACVVLYENPEDFIQFKTIVAPYYKQVHPLLFSKLCAENKKPCRQAIANYLNELKQQQSSIQLISLLAADDIHQYSFEAKQDRTGFLLLHLIETAVHTDCVCTLRSIHLITRSVLHFQSAVDPDIATLTTMVKTVNQERGQFTVKLIDIGQAPLSASVLLALQAKPTIVALRDNTLFVEHFERIDLKKNIETPIVPSVSATQGVDVILGGTGHVGLQYAKALLLNHQRPIILIQRTDPKLLQNPQTAKDEQKASAIMKLQQLAPGRVEVWQADVGHLDSLKSCLMAIIHQHMSIHTLIHTAGVDASMHYRPMPAIDETFFHQCFYAKRDGLIHIAQLAEELPIHHCHVVSSISSILGGIGMYVYSSLHAYVDAFVIQQASRASNQWSVIRWEAWDFDTSASEPEAFQHGAFGNHLNTLAIKPEQGVELLKQWFTSPEPFSIISSMDLQSRFTAWVETESLENEFAGDEKAPRPELSSEYHQAISLTQKKIAAIWADILAMDDIGIDDNFFELGGHSLLALRMVNQLKQQLHLPLSIVDLFAFPTIRKLASKMEGQHQQAEQYLDINKKQIARSHALSELKNKRSQRARI